MEPTQESRTQDVNQRPEEQKRMAKTNQFYRLASQAMDLPREEAVDVSKCILRNVIRRILPTEARQFISQLPMELKKECSQFCQEPDKSIDARSVVDEIMELADLDENRAREAAKNFWSFLTGWFNEYEDEQKGETFQVLDELPMDLKVLFGSAKLQ